MWGFGCRIEAGCRKWKNETSRFAAFASPGLGAWSLDSVGAEATILRSLLGGSWVVISRGISRVTILIAHIRGFVTPLISTQNNLQVGV